MTGRASPRDLVSSSIPCTTRHGKFGCDQHDLNGHVYVDAHSSQNPFYRDPLSTQSHVKLHPVPFVHTDESLTSVVTISPKASKHVVSHFR